MPDNRYLQARKNVVLKRLANDEDKITTDSETYTNPASKKVYFFVDGECKGFYDSITLCANTLGLTRAGVKKAIEFGTELDNGFILKLTNK